MTIKYRQTSMCLKDRYSIKYKYLASRRFPSPVLGRMVAKNIHSPSIMPPMDSHSLPRTEPAVCRFNEAVSQGASSEAASSFRGGLSQDRLTLRT